MDTQDRHADIEALAKMAARLAGRNPDERVKIELADIVPFDDVLWRYPDFLCRAEAAYYALTSPSLDLPPSRNGHVHAAITRHWDGVGGNQQLDGLAP